MVYLSLSFVMGCGGCCTLSLTDVEIIKECLDAYEILQVFFTAHGVILYINVNENLCAVLVMDTGTITEREHS